MTQHALSHRVIAGVPRAGRAVGRPMLRFVMDRFLLLPLGAAIAIVWANTSSESYFRFAHAWSFPVNEIGMTLFLALIAQDTLEALMPGGALHTWRRWGMPVVAAAGGILGAAFVFLSYVSLRDEHVLAQAWPIACSIDIAAGYYVLKMIYRRSNALPFLLVLAIVTNAVGLLVLATWTPFTTRHLGGALVIVLALAVAALMRRSRVKAFWPYFAIAGPLSWWGFYWADVHPALALVPIVPFLPREPRRIDVFADPADDDSVHHVEHEWNEVVQIVVFLFGLVNAGVLLRGYDTGTWAIVLAALVGRPLGILFAVQVARAAGLQLPRGLGWGALTVTAFATSSGFTLALFFSTALLPTGAVLQQIKVGALATVAGAFVALLVARFVHSGRFAHPVRAR
jgi:NhaA family Na+:H+ antiporter